MKRCATDVGKTLAWFALPALVIIGICGVWAEANAGSADIEAGYVFYDREGNRAVNQETFNTYEGLGLSIRNLSYLVSPKWHLSADLRNLTLDNRNLTASLFSQGRLTANFKHHQYRKPYDFSGGLQTERSSSAMDITVTPAKQLSLFGGVSILNVDGYRTDIIDVTDDQTALDYDQVSYNAGARYIRRQGSVYLQYFRNDYDDNLVSARGRTTDGLRASASLSVPNNEWLLISGGVYLRKDQLDAGEYEIKSNMGWAGIKAYLPHQMHIDYQFSFARTDQNSLEKETDNVINTLTAGRVWSGIGGVRIGYENRIADDLTDRTESHGFLANGWLRVNRNFKLRGSASYRDQDVVDGATLIGDRSVSKHKLAGWYRIERLGTLEMQWYGTISKHDPSPVIRATVDNDTFGSRADYNGVSAAITIDRAEYGAARISYTYNKGDYENNSDSTDYEFSDHIIRARIVPVTLRGFDLSANGTYFRSKRDKDIEKFQLGFGAVYATRRGYEIGAEYNVFNFDDFSDYDRYYTANIVRVYVRKQVTF